MNGLWMLEVGSLSIGVQSSEFVFLCVQSSVALYSYVCKITILQYGILYYGLTCTYYYDT